VRHDRFLLPALPAAFALAGAGAAWIIDRLPARARRGPAWAAVALAAVAPPLAASAGFVRDASRPLTADQALDWAAANLPAGARVLTRLDLGLDRSRVEVHRVAALRGPAQLAEADYVIATHRDDAAPLAVLEPRARFAPRGRYDGPPITVYAVPAVARAAYRDVLLDPAAIDVSSGAAAATALVDGDPRTFWHTEVIQRAGDFVVVRFPPARVARIELLLGSHAKFAGREVAVQLADAAGRWHRAATAPGRPRVEEQDGARGYSQVFLVTPPAPASGLRLELTRNGGRRWGMAELRVQALPE
jgi:hypothetical protein